MIARVCISICAAIITIACAIDLVSIGSTVYMVTDAAYYRCTSGSATAYPRYPWDDFDCANSTNATTVTQQIAPKPYMIAVIVGGRVLIVALGCTVGTIAVFTMSEMTLTQCNYYTAIIMIVLCCISPLLALCTLSPAIFAVCACKELHTPVFSFPDIQMPSGGATHTMPPQYGSSEFDASKSFP